MSGKRWALGGSGRVALGSSKQRTKDFACKLGHLSKTRRQESKKISEENNE